MAEPPSTWRFARNSNEIAHIKRQFVILCGFKLKDCRIERFGYHLGCPPWPAISQWPKRRNPAAPEMRVCVLEDGRRSAEQVVPPTFALQISELSTLLASSVSHPPLWANPKRRVT